MRSTEADGAEGFNAKNQPLSCVAKFFMRNLSEPVTLFPADRKPKKPRQPAMGALPEGVRSWIESCFVPNMVRAYIARHGLYPENAVAQSTELVAQCSEKASTKETEDDL